MDNNDVLDAALELFFRSNLAKPREVRPKYYKFHAHVVAGVHKRTCDDCWADFNNEERFFEHDDAHHSGWSSSQKLCKVCMIKVMETQLENSSAAIYRDLCHIRERQRNIPTQKIGYESKSDFLHAFANDPKNPFGPKQQSPTELL